jgi:putative inorganic carbon (HCO3(-)) transporter
MNAEGIQLPGSTARLSLAVESDLAARAGASALPCSKAEPPGAYRRFGALAANSLVAAVLSPFLALTVGSVPRILLAIVILDIPFEFGTHLYYREDEAALGALGGLSISATTIALAGLYISWFMRSQANRNSGARPSLHINLPLLMYLAISVISMAVAQDVSLSLFEVFLLLEACLVYFYVANTVRTRQDVLFVVSLLLIACLLESFAMIALRFASMPSTIWGVPTHVRVDTDVKEGFMRIGGTVGSPNFAAAYLSLSLASAAGLLFTKLGRAHKWLARAVMGFGGVALIFTFSRGGWMALALSVTVIWICLLGWRRRRVSLKTPIAVILILGTLYLPFHSAISARLLGDDRGSAESRIPLMKLAFRIIEDNPVLGVGVNNFTVVMDRYLTSDFREGWLFAVHNKYLLVLAETGILGLLAFLAFLLDALRRGWQCWALRDHLLSPIALGIMAGIAGHMVHMTVDVFRGRPTQQLLWLLAGFLAAMHRICVADQRSSALSNIT